MVCFVVILGRYYSAVSRLTVSSKIIIIEVLILLKIIYSPKEYIALLVVKDDKLNLMLSLGLYIESLPIKGLVPAE